MNSTLKKGDFGTEVKLLQSLLQSQGFFNDSVLGNFRERTLSAVLHFQQTHNGPDKKPLTVDGVVGPNTWWALNNPSGQEQRNGRPQETPSGLSNSRGAIITWAEKEHAAGVKEVPDGSNWSPRISQYLIAAGIDYPAPWCQSFALCGCKESLIIPYPPGKTASVAKAWYSAQNKGLAHECSGPVYTPRPGDQFVMLNGDGTGHTGFVYRVSKNLKEINTLEGNCGNRVALQRRKVSSIHGFINIFGDAKDPINFALGLVKEETANSGTR